MAVPLWSTAPSEPNAPHSEISRGGDRPNPSLTEPHSGQKNWIEKRLKMFVKQDGQDDRNFTDRRERPLSHQNRDDSHPEASSSSGSRNQLHRMGLRGWPNMYQAAAARPCGGLGFRSNSRRLPRKVLRPRLENGRPQNPDPADSRSRSLQALLPPIPSRQSSPLHGGFRAGSPVRGLLSRGRRLRCARAKAVARGGRPR